MKLKEFVFQIDNQWPPEEGGTSLAPPLDPPMTTKLKLHSHCKPHELCERNGA